MTHQLLVTTCSCNINSPGKLPCPLSINFLANVSQFDLTLALKWQSLPEEWGQLHVSSLLCPGFFLPLVRYQLTESSTKLSTIMAYSLVKHCLLQSISQPCPSYGSVATDDLTCKTFCWPEPLARDCLREAGSFEIVCAR